MIPVNVGVLGCADVAVRKMLPALAGHPAVRLVAVASRTADKAAAVAGRFGCAAVTGYRRLLQRDDIEAVYVPLPPTLHTEWIQVALDSEKHVLAEKPLTTSLTDTRAVVDHARMRGLVLMENVTFLHHRRQRRVRALVAGGSIGEPLAFTGSFTVPPRPSEDIRHSRSLGGGALLDAAVYPLVAAQTLLGGDLQVVGAALRYDDRTRVDVAGAALLRRADGVTAQVTFGMNHMYTSTYDIVGSHGRVRVEHAFHPGHRGDADRRGRTGCGRPPRDHGAAGRPVRQHRHRVRPRCSRRTAPWHRQGVMHRGPGRGHPEGRGG
ncbi:Gfo/Idh/MocA family oxidoreductase [Kibdelosporangium lantanae]